MGEDNDGRRRLAQQVRDACIRAAREGYEQAAISGLCEEGALEAALSAIHMLDLDEVLRQAEQSKPQAE
ncbi:MAG TPA: hypothetical protein VF203_06270 [Burkholderiales bacterium]